MNPGFLRSVTRHPLFSGFALFCMALGVRVAAIDMVRPDPIKVFMFDPTLHYLLAYNIAHGHGFTVSGAATAAVTPGYPAVLGGSFAVFGSTLSVALATNAVLGALTVVLVYLLVRHTTSVAAALVAGLALALLPGHALFATVLMAENLAAPMVVALSLLFVLTYRREEPPSLRPAVMCGALLGAALLVRGEFIVWPLAAGLALLGAGYGPRVAGRHVMVMAGIAIVATAPWVIRNQMELGAPTLTTTSAGNALYVSIGPYFQEFTPADVTFVEPGLSREDEEVQSAREQTRQALRYAARHPGEELRRVPIKVRRLVSEDVGALRWAVIDPDAVSASDEHALRRWSNVSYWAIALVAVAGTPLWFRRRDPGDLMLAATMLAWLALHSTIFAGEPHYHVALLPLLAAMFGRSAVEFVGLATRDSTA